MQDYSLFNYQQNKSERKRERERDGEKNGMIQQSATI